MNLTAVFFSSHPDRVDAVEVVDRLKKQGISYRQFSGNWVGGGQKIRMAHYSATHLSCTHVMLMDAFDVLCLGGEEEILNRFLEFGKPWVGSTENNCWPDSSLAALYPPCSTQWRYLNAGVYISEREYLAEALSRWGGDKVPENIDDQLWLTGKYLAEPGVITLDTNCHLFQSMLVRKKKERGRWIEVDAERTRCKNLVTGTNPLILHFNGTALHDTNMSWWNQFQQD